MSARETSSCQNTWNTPGPSTRLVFLWHVAPATGFWFTTDHRVLWLCCDVAVRTGSGSGLYWRMFQNRTFPFGARAEKIMSFPADCWGWIMWKPKRGGRIPKCSRSLGRPDPSFLALAASGWMGSHSSPLICVGWRAWSYMFCVSGLETFFIIWWNVLDGLQKTTTRTGTENRSIGETFNPLTRSGNAYHQSSRTLTFPVRQRMQRLQEVWKGKPTELTRWQRHILCSSPGRIKFFMVISSHADELIVMRLCDFNLTELSEAACCSVWEWTVDSEPDCVWVLTPTAFLWASEGEPHPARHAFTVWFLCSSVTGGLRLSGLSSFHGLSVCCNLFNSVLIKVNTHLTYQYFKSLLVEFINKFSKLLVYLINNSRHSFNWMIYVIIH